MALVNFELIQELREAAEAYLREEVERVTGVPPGDGENVFTPDNLAIVTGSPRPHRPEEPSPAVGTAGSSNGRVHA